jgi:hypothetical protein
LSLSAPRFTSFLPSLMGRGMDKEESFGHG